MIRIENLTGEYLKNVSFEVPTGYICGIIGENGAGKTTLINTILGIKEHEAGNVVIDVDKSEIGFILDEALFNEHEKVKTIAKYYGSMYPKFDKDVFFEYLKEFGIDINKKYKELSKGMKIKTQLAFALSYDAKLFIFDEPTAGLDEYFVEEFRKICVDLVSDGEKTVIISSNITEDFDRIADYIVYVQEGKVLFCESQEEVLSQFMLVKAEDYKIKLLPKELVIYVEKGKYESTAMGVASKLLDLDQAYETERPTIREVMHYLVKGGHENAEAITKKYISNNDSF